MTLSVIIPVYGVEHTLDRCVESVVRQTFDDWEIILVDDGSPDKSAHPKNNIYQDNVLTLAKNSLEYLKTR